MNSGANHTGLVMLVNVGPGHSPTTDIDVEMSVMVRAVHHLRPPGLGEYDYESALAVSPPHRCGSRASDTGRTT
jgi:hypothetical protein